RSGTSDLLIPENPVHCARFTCCWLLGDPHPSAPMDTTEDCFERSHVVRHWGLYCCPGYLVYTLCDALPRARNRRPFDEGGFSNLICAQTAHALQRDRRIGIPKRMVRPRRAFRP